MFKISELQHKDVINESDGKKMGAAYDIELDPASGRLRALVLPGESRFLGLFSRGEELIVPWEKIRRIGVDVILVGEEEIHPRLTEKAASPEGSGAFNWDDWEI